MELDPLRYDLLPDLDDVVELHRPDLAEPVFELRVYPVDQAVGPLPSQRRDERLHVGPLGPGRNGVLVDPEMVCQLLAVEAADHQGSELAPAALRFLRGDCGRRVQVADATTVLHPTIVSRVV